MLVAVASSIMLVLFDNSYKNYLQSSPLNQRLRAAQLRCNCATWAARQCTAASGTPQEGAGQLPSLVIW